MGLFNNWFKSREDKLLDQIFNLKFTAKQLARTAAKCEREEKTLKAKVDKMKKIEAQRRARREAEEAEGAGAPSAEPAAESVPVS